MNHVMKDFSSTTITETIVEWAGVARLGGILQQRFSVCRVLLVTDPGLVEAGILLPVLHNLQDVEFQVTVYDRAQSGPYEHFVREAIQIAHDSHYGIVIGLGGDLLLDVAKLVAILISSEQELPEFHGIGKVTGQHLSLVNILTTAGTGSGVTNVAILTMYDDGKMGIASPQPYGDLVLLDTRLTLGLPPVHTIAAGIDAMVHAIEAYAGKHKKNLLSDALIRKVLCLIGRHLAVVCRDGNNCEARKSALLDVALAGQASANSPVAVVCTLAYPLDVRHHIPHGLPNVPMLIPVLQFNVSAVAPLYGELVAVIEVKVTGDAANDAWSFIVGMVEIIAATGAPDRLCDANVPEKDLPLLAHNVMQQIRLPDDNPVALTEDDALWSYQQAF